MSEQSLPVHVHSSHPTFISLIQEVMDRPDVEPSMASDPNVAHVLLDFPLTWSMYQLERLDSIDRARTLIVTQAIHPAYLDCLASYHVSGVVTSTDGRGLVAALYAAAAAQRSYHYKSPLTFMELRVVRLLLMGFDTKRAARDLGVSFKTVNAHVSNALCKLGHDNRAQLVVHMMGAEPFPSEAA
ncbi:MAG: helix-turn-helix transcriptional regulator [Trueperaceae bacterium]|nr:helix-turn-helix transcriptional regulator [Trueperaceae bacterium]